MIRLSALVATSILVFAGAAQAAKAPLAIYYSFDTPVTPALLAVMESELGRILAPSGMSAAWLPSGVPRHPGEDFPALVVFRFQGRCGFDGPVSDAGTDSSGGALAETDTVEGHVLPFSRVNCDRVRDYIAPVLGSMPPAWTNEMLGRALARVSAHEIYHMLAGIRIHGDRGIFQSAHSRRDLTGATFAFAAPENNWLRSWLQRQAAVEQITRALPGNPDDPVFGESGALDAAGR
jgi:hypothetical protein